MLEFKNYAQTEAISKQIAMTVGANSSSPGQFSLYTVPSGKVFVGKLFCTTGSAIYVNGIQTPWVTASGGYYGVAENFEFVAGTVLTAYCNGGSAYILGVER
jgi:hypothetical protein